MVEQDVFFHSGKVNITLLRPFFSSASKLVFWQRLSSFVIDREAVSDSSASSDKSTQSQVSASISPMRSEQPKDKNIASFKTGFSQIARAYFTSLAVHESRSVLTHFGRVTFSVGFLEIQFHATAFRKAPRIKA